MIARVGVVHHRAGMARVRAAAAAARAVRPGATSPGEHPAGMARVRHNKVEGAAALGVIFVGTTGVATGVIIANARSGGSRWFRCRTSWSP